MNPVDKVIAVNQDVCDFAEIFRQYNVISLEQSVKVHNNTVNNGRILVKFELASMPADHLLELLGQMSFPVEYMYWLYNNISSNNYVMIGLDSDTKVYRLYFERRISRHAELNTPHESINSVKWTFDHKGIQMTKYFTVLTDSIDTVIDTAKSCGISHLPEFVTDYLENETIVNFMFANDFDSDRTSICIPFKPDRIYIKDFDSFIGYPVKHYQTGMDKDDNVFSTYYFSIYRNIRN